jgi:hypothetical protein
MFKKGQKLRQIMEKPFEGTVTRYGIDQEHGTPTVILTRPVLDEKGQPKMIKSTHYDAILEPDPNNPEATIEVGRENVREEYIPEVEEKSFRLDQVEAVPDDE